VISRNPAIRNSQFAIRQTDDVVSITGGVRSSLPAMPAPLRLSREQILGHRRRAGALDSRLRRGTPSLRRAAWVGLQDSVPRSAVLSLHARVTGVEPDGWDHPSLVQVWGPRFAAYVVPERDRARFTLMRLPDPGPRRERAETTADRLCEFLDGRRMSYSDAGKAMGVSPNSLRYAAPTGRVLIRWEGARRPELWCVPAPDTTPERARADMAKRYLHVLGPATPESFAGWAGIPDAQGAAAFEAVRRSIAAVSTPVGEAWMLSADEDSLRRGPGAEAPARLLPSGDAYFLLWGAGRSLLVPDAAQRDRLWTSRVWPGAVLVEGEIVGTWRRAGALVTVEPWRRLTAASKRAVEEEAGSLPLPDLDGPVEVRWE
jgi:hypothetical protein